MTLRPPLNRLVLALFALAGPTAAADSTLPPAPDECTPGSLRLASYHFIVDGAVFDRLAGHVEPGDNFTLVAAVAACDGTTAIYALELQVPPCLSPLREPFLAAIGALTSDDPTDTAMRALLEDLRAAAACDSFDPRPWIPRALAATTVAGGGGLGVLLIVRRRRKRVGPRT